MRIGQRRQWSVAWALAAILLLLPWPRSRVVAGDVWVGNATRAPAGLVAPGETVKIRFEIWPRLSDGARGFVRWTADGWATYQDVEAVKVGQSGNNDVLEVSIPGHAAGTRVEYAIYGTHGGVTKWWSDADPNDRNNNEGWVVSGLRSGRIYQAFVRVWGATGTTKATTGKFAHLDSTALAQIRDLGFDWIWLTGVMQMDQLSPAHKGNAGSPYAIHDYFRTASDQGSMSDLESLIQRAHAAGLKVMIDLVFNHTSRDYHTADPTLPDFSDANYEWVQNADGSWRKAYGDEPSIWGATCGCWTDTALLRRGWTENNNDPSNPNSTYYKLDKGRRILAEQRN